MIKQDKEENKRIHTNTTQRNTKYTPQIYTYRNHKIIENRDDTIVHYTDVRCVYALHIQLHSANLCDY